MRYLVWSLMCFLLCMVSCDSEPQSLERPNIVWITSEDNSKHYLSLFDSNGVETPNIEKLAAEGIRFTRAFSNAPVCSVARSALISGCYGPRIGTQYHRREKLVPMPEGVQMFPAYLKEAGYHTTNNRKEDYNIIKPDGVWDDSSAKASWTQRAKGQPFFHVFNIGTTHESRLHFSKESMDSIKTQTQLTDFKVHPNHPNTPLFQYTNALYRDKIRTMDEQLGAVVSELEKEGLLDSTFIFYFGDHGGVLPGSKGYIYETGLHVPLVVYIPEKYKHLTPLKKGSATKGFVGFIDFGPTVLHLAGVPIPEGMDGTPFLGKDINTQALNQRDEAFGYADRFDEKYDLVRSFRKGKYKYIRNFQPFNYDALMNNYRYKQLAYQEWHSMFQDGKLNKVQAQFFEPRAPEQLFDLEVDPYETTNLALDPGFGSVLESMRTKLMEQAKEMSDLSFYPESFLVQNAFDNPVLFGRENKQKIASYIDVANLSLLDFKQAKPALEIALDADDPWQRYWALIACSSFGHQAEILKNKIREIARTDNVLLNKVRAAEFLGVIGIDPSAVMTEALYQSQDGTEALLILNSVVLMKDGPQAYSFNIDFSKLAPQVKENAQVGRRLEYLNLL